MIEFFLQVSRKLITLVLLYPVFFGTCARDMIAPSAVWFFSLKVRKMIPFCRVLCLKNLAFLSQNNLEFQSW